MSSNWETIREEMQKFIREVFPIEKEMSDDAIEPDLSATDAKPMFSEQQDE